MKQLVVHLPQQIRIVFRGDSGYFVGELLDQQSWRPISNCPGWQQCEFVHQCGSWSRSRRFVAVRRLKKSDMAMHKKPFSMTPFTIFFVMSPPSALLLGRLTNAMEKERPARRGWMKLKIKWGWRILKAAILPPAH